MNNVKLYSDWMETGVLCDRVTPDDELFLDCIATACEQYGIKFSEATDTEIQFICKRAKELLPEAVSAL